ncbi:ABC-type lipoprotein export system, ATPase component [Desulfitobacterium chlororespirans DSM 11544]|uniref:ABC-type lipoprotein export system, ATPase component n=2 Tax=Desulfitobacterium chlororespirans TaxID=51616 RepID=A0A1M7SNK9_9FIRM|nr:ATP-binding cassette domain-containing protein [Desulfitobacterium chlororespirans]SHN60053.1 ABC-type lipoprotein export system, ATPase component [Desulfitobacterium chlororespirans DSM 11544]
MLDIKELLSMKITDLEMKYPFVVSFFNENKLNTFGFKEYSFEEYLNRLNPMQLKVSALSKEQMKANFLAFAGQRLIDPTKNTVTSLTILPGTDKSGNPESFKEFTVHKGEIVSIVGPTGSGKSRLLADIEWMANKDTPSRRTLLINGERPDYSNRFSISNKLVAQLSQNMNFVMDLTVKEFLELHAEGRMIENRSTLVGDIIWAANDLSGETFDMDTPVVALSGGQARALMIADTALLSSSPIVLIDEIENAGIDRKRAIHLLIDAEKIVIIATHDPSLALSANKRINIKNGGIEKITETSAMDKEILKELENMDRIINRMRVKLRNGDSLE